jgi:hypothetical protein
MLRPIEQVLVSNQCTVQATSRHYNAHAAERLAAD